MGNNTLADRMARLGIAAPTTPAINPIAGAVSRQAQADGARLTTAAEREANAAAVEAWNRYSTASPFERARLREHYGATLELGQSLAETATASRTLPAPAPAQLTATEAAQQFIDRHVFEQHQALAQTNPFAAASYHLENLESIERGSRVRVPEPVPAPAAAPSPAPAPAPNPPPQDPPPTPPPLAA